MTFHGSSSNETEGLLSSFATIRQSHLRKNEVTPKSLTFWGHYRKHADMKYSTICSTH